MKIIAAIASFFAATLITAGSAMAQDHLVKATVPFNFTINGSSVLPAGNYTIGSDSTSANTLSITGRKVGVHLWAMGLIDPNEPGKAGKLVFHRYGDQYFLSEVRYPGSSMKVRFPVSKREKRARKQTQVADRHVGNEVMIALN